MVKLRSMKIGDLGRVVTGKTPPSSRPELFGKLHPFLTPTDIDGFARYIEPSRFLSPQGGDYQQRLMLPARAVCVVCIGATIGKVCMTNRPSFTNQQINAVIVNEGEHDPFFVYSLLTTLRDELKANAGGAATPIINKTAFSEIEIGVPLLSAQRRIASILSAYDQLTENCQRRVRILEEMARALYREWFVRFQFPSHQKVPRVDSPLGAIPKGWAVTPVSQAVEIDPHVSVPRDGEKPFVPMGCLATESMLITDIETRTGNSGSKFQNGDTLFARITPCLENGKTGFVQFLPDRNAVAFGSTEFIVMRSRTLTPEFVYLLARNDEFRGNAIKSMAGASGRQRVQEKCFDSFLIAHPPRDLLARFSAIVSPNFQLIHKLQLKIENLRRTRDLLLPRLLSGQVSLDVSAVEDVAEPRAPAPATFPTDLASEEPALRAAEEAPTYRSSKRIS
jgi:type I restriction enzyme S subunit